MKLAYKFVWLLLAGNSAMVMAQDPIPKQFDSNVLKWQAVQVPPKSDDDAYSNFFMRANWSRASWYVSWKKGLVLPRLLAEGQHPPRTESPKVKFKLPGDDRTCSLLTFHRVEDGWLGASNRGEFGSDVLWMSNDGKRTQQLSGHSVYEFVALNGHHLAVEGGAYEGSVIEFTKDKDKWGVQTLVKLSQPAMAVAVLTDHSLCVATYSGLLAVSLTGKVEILVPENTWDGLFPNSVVVDAVSGIAYVGMRQFVVRVNLRNKKQAPDFLVPGLNFLNKTTTF